LKFGVLAAIGQVLEATPPVGAAHEHAVVREEDRRQAFDGAQLDSTRSQRDQLLHAAVLVHQRVDVAQRHQRAQADARRADA
jgi:hypothetical protein